MLTLPLGFFSVSFETFTSPRLDYTAAGLCFQPATPWQSRDATRRQQPRLVASLTPPAPRWSATEGSGALRALPRGRPRGAGQPPLRALPSLWGSGARRAVSVGAARAPRAPLPPPSPTHAAPRARSAPRPATATFRPPATEPHAPANRVPPSSKRAGLAGQSQAAVFRSARAPPRQAAAGGGCHGHGDASPPAPTTGKALIRVLSGFIAFTNFLKHYKR